MNGAHLLMVRENAWACLGRLGSSENLRLEVLKLEAALIASQLLLERQPTEEHVERVFAGLREGVQQLIFLLENDEVSP